MEEGSLDTHVRDDLTPHMLTLQESVTGMRDDVRRLVDARLPDDLRKEVDGIKASIEQLQAQVRPSTQKTTTITTTANVCGYIIQIERG